MHAVVREPRKQSKSYRPDKVDDEIFESPTDDTREYDRDRKKDKKKSRMEQVMDECRRLLQVSWGYEGDTAKRNDRYRKIHKSMLHTDPTVSDLKYYDEIKTNKSSLINAITAKYGSGPREFCFYHPITGLMITLDDTKQQIAMRDECRDKMWFGFENTDKEDDGALIWDKAATNKGNLDSFIPI